MSHEHSCHCCQHDSCKATSTNNLKELAPALCSGILLLTGVLIEHFLPALLPATWCKLTFYFIAYLPVATSVWREAFEGMAHKDFFNEFSLMGIATIGAFGIGEYPEAVGVMLFYSVGEWFQDRAVNKSRRSVKALMDVRPDHATRVLPDGSKAVVPPEEVAVGETIEIKAGERIPLDGFLQSSSASFDTAALTGESEPRTFMKDEEVLAGMIPISEVVYLKVGKPYADSALSRILHLVEEAAERKAPAELFIHKFAKIYTPIVIASAFAIAVIPLLLSFFLPNIELKDWIYRALIFLVISCPCALVISVPLSYFAGIGAASRHGVLFKGGNFMNALRKIRTLVFDKTGTLTQGSFSVEATHAAEGFTEQEVAETMSAVESFSNHPIATAIARIPTTLTATEVEELAGLGMRATLNGQTILVGGTKLLASCSVAYPTRLEETLKPIVCCAIDGKFAGYMLLSDLPKADALGMVQALNGLNITDLHILSGDRTSLVADTAKRLGIENYSGDLLPEEKVWSITKIKESCPAGSVAFVGDGINDAPSLALADVGIAIGGTGSDAAIETADVVLQGDGCQELVSAVRAARATHKIVIENISFALGVKLAILLLGILGIANLWEAVFADVGVALIAIANAMRLQRMKL